MNVQKVKLNEEITIEVVVDEYLGMLVNNEQAAVGFGVGQEAIRKHKHEKPNELQENKHWVMREVETEVGKRTANFWTLRGILRLQVYIQTPEALIFGAWAEGAIFDGNAGEVVGRKELLRQKASLDRQIKAKKRIVDAIQDVADLNALKTELNDVQQKLRNMDTRYVSGVLKTWDEAARKKE